MATPGARTHHKYLNTLSKLKPARYPLPRRPHVNRNLIPPTDLYYNAYYVARHNMEAGRPKRLRARISYVEPTELDDDIADPEIDHEVTDAVTADDDQPSDTEDGVNDDSDSDEFTTDKKKLKAQEMKKKAKKIKNKKIKKIKNVPFPFMDLPPEIRVMIYKECLVESARDLSYVNKGNSSRDFYRGSVQKRRSYWNGFTYKTKREKHSDSDRTVLQPVLLRVCKAIRDEALPYLYAQTFHFGTPATFQLFLGRISPANRMLLRDIVIKGWNDYRNNRIRDVYTVFSLLTTATNIKSILLDRHVWSETDNGVGRGRTHTFDAHGFWLDIEYWADAVDAVHGKGAAKGVIKFTKLCFGSLEEIENEDEALNKREQDFMANLKFSEKPSDKPAVVDAVPEEK